MKRIEFLLSAAITIFLMNGLVFGQDTTLTVTSNGNVGIGTANPELSLHVDGNGILSSGSLSGYVFRDRNSISTNDWVWYATNDIARFHRIGAGDFMTVTNSGNIGIGTTSPGAKTHIKGVGTGTSQALLITNSANAVNVTLFDNGNLGLGDQGPDATLEIVQRAGTDLLDLSSSTSGDGDIMTVTNNGYVGIGTTGPIHPLEMGSGAHVTSGGVWTNASSREYKENIRELTVDEAIEVLSGLSPVQFNYKADKDEDYLGFVAEEVPDLVATKDRKGLNSMDIVAILTRVVQQQQMKIEELEARLNANN